MSAIIYQFPVGGRTATGNAREQAKPGVTATSASPAVTACGSAWYHEAAMQEEDRTRKR